MDRTAHTLHRCESLLPLEAHFFTHVCHDTPAHEVPPLHAAVTVRAEREPERGRHAAHAGAHVRRLHTLVVELRHGEHHANTASVIPGVLRIISSAAVNSARLGCGVGTSNSDVARTR